MRPEPRSDSTPNVRQSDLFPWDDRVEVGNNLRMSAIGVSLVQKSGLQQYQHRSSYQE